MFSYLLLIAAFLAGQPQASSGSDIPFHVIVHRANPVSSISRAELSAMFLRRIQRWPDGRAVQPIDQPLRSSLRERFSHDIHGKSVSYVTRYWQRLIFSGRSLPPPSAASDSAVIDFVTRNRGAIGYTTAPPPEGGAVKAITVTGLP